MINEEILKSALKEIEAYIRENDIDCIGVQYIKGNEVDGDVYNLKDDEQMDSDILLMCSSQTIMAYASVLDIPHAFAVKLALYFVNGIHNMVVGIRKDLGVSSAEERESSPHNINLH